MSKSADAYIGFGVKFEIGEELPWGDVDPDDWWLLETGFNYDEGAIPFAANGDWKPEYEFGANGGEALSEKYFDARQKWREEHPFPVKLFKCGSYEECELFACVPSSVIRGDWEAGVSFASLGLDDCSLDELKAFFEFGAKYFPKKSLSWWLAAFMG